MHSIRLAPNRARLKPATHCPGQLHSHCLNRIFRWPFLCIVNPEVCIDSLAREVGYSRAHFLRMFRKSTGTTPYQYVMQRRFDGGGSPTTLFLGRFKIDRKEVEPILHVLPGFLHLKLDARRAHSFQSVLDLLVLETEQPGLAPEAVIGRLCEMLFIHTIRVHAQTLAANSGGWLAGWRMHSSGPRLQHSTTI